MIGKPGLLGLLVLSLSAAGAHAQAPRADVRIEDCLGTAQAALGGDATHVEFESRDGRPMYEFIVVKGDDRLYVACDGSTGNLAEVDVIVAAGDAQWTALAKVDEAAARNAATERYKGEVEEVKRLLLSNGSAAYEVDVEIEGADGEYNVYVDAATGRISEVNIEYWEIGTPGSTTD